MASDSFSRESYELFLVATGARGMVVIETTGGGGRCFMHHFGRGRNIWNTFLFLYKIMKNKILFYLEHNIDC